MTAKEVFTPYAKRLKPNPRSGEELTPDNVYQEGIPENRKVIGEMADNFLLPGSRVVNGGNLRTLYGYCKEGKSCLMLLEHYSNFDFPIFIRLVEKDPELGHEVADSIMPIVGAKLIKSKDTITTPFTTSYDRIMIFPSRTLDKISDPAEKAEIRKISTPLNHAAMKELIVRKHHGRLVLVFPAGTRYRPWDLDSKKGVREIYSYLKTFDYLVFISINGNCLLPDKSDDMNRDKPVRDVLMFNVSAVEKGRDFRERVLRNAPPESDPRQYVVDCVMNELDRVHDEVEPERQRILKEIRKDQSSR
jgi:glycerol-3-phosphate O-acyltransferase